MARISYVNGRYVHHQDAALHIEDRATQFGDAVYEVWAVRDGKTLDDKGHFERLERSLNELRIEMPLGVSVFKIIIRRLVELNRLKNGIIYLQISRGQAPRDHAFPKYCVPNIVLTAQKKDFKKLSDKAAIGLKVKTARDMRWKRVDIKTTNLLPNLLAKQDAIESGFDDVWFLDEENYITEASAQNCWIINKNGDLQTRQLGNDILAGVTRKTLIEIAKNHQFNVVEKKFSLQEAYDAQACFITSATSFVTAITQINHIKINGGAIHRIVVLMRDYYLNV